MGIAFKIKNKLLDALARFQRPRMIYGFISKNKTYLPLVRVGSTTFIDHPEKLEVDDNVYIGQHNFIEASHGIKIETGCQITNFVTITTHSSHNSIRYYKNPPTGEIPKGYKLGSIEIGKYTFVGPHTVIMPGTKIGKGCLVAAFSYLDGTYPDFSIIRGLPAEVIGSTKEIDQPFLEQNPELKAHYFSWASI
jgi:acetyltransferase-like isoleucine patch superfamily enzyme